MNVFVADESSTSREDVVRCPFLRDVNEPTNLSFSSSVALPLPVRETKGPIFEDGPDFDMSYRLFHGQNGAMPLSRDPLWCTEKTRSGQSPRRFEPLAAKAAVVSLSGLGGSFGFDAFHDMFMNQRQKHKSSKKESSKKADSTHEPMGEEWLQNGSCPIAKSYRAVTHVLPLVAKAFKPPPAMTYRCPPAIVSARAALARTAFAKTLRPQPLPAKVLLIGAMGLAANVPLGAWREHTEKFSPAWFAAVHAAVPFIAMARKSVLMPKAAMAFTIAAAVLGQVVGSRAERYRLKAADVGPVDGGAEAGGGGSRCGDGVALDSVPLGIAGPVF